MKYGLQIEPDLYLSLKLELKIRIWFLIKIYDVIIKINRIHLGLEFTKCNLQLSWQTNIVAKCKQEV